MAAPEPSDILESNLAAEFPLPAFGSHALYVIVVLAAATFALALASAKRPRLLAAARSAAYATCALVWFDLLLLAYAFITHDFRIRYVARYSDRTMSTGYLFTALWGGQDGSLLWWLFLLSVNTSACVAWMGKKWRPLQPYVIATLVAIMGFFVVIMAFSANPFAESIAGARADGEGLNPLLQNFYMIIHPPSLYTGFVGCAVPFAFAIAALASGRLDEEWLVAVRKWMLFAWTFLTIGNVLGMLWAYEELGWGGYWAWDPVENAAFMPWLTASAFVHSTMIQERRRMLKIWNVVLIAQTFFMTIFGTFLTRSGMIASVHAFAQSSIGIYFSYFMVTIVCVTAGLVVYRLPELKNLDGDEPATRLYREKVGPVVVATLGLALVVAGVVRFATPKMLPVAAVALGTVQFLGGYGMARMRRSFVGYPWGDFSTSTWVSALAVALVAPGVFTIGGFVTYWIACRVIPPAKATEDSKKSAAVATEIDAVASREAAFVANNWILLSMQAVIGLLTVFPLISEAVIKEKVTVGPKVFTAVMLPLGLAMYALMGVAPLLGWRKTSESALKKAFRVPVTAGLVVGALHFAVGKRFGLPAIIDVDPIWPNAFGQILKYIAMVTPVLATAIGAFNVAVIVQEFWRGIASRTKAHDEGFLTALGKLVGKARRRYGGYVVHLGIVVMFLGFAGSGYKTDREVALRPGESFEFQGYQFTYVKSRRVDTDPAKMEIYTDIHMRKGGKDLGILSPAKFVYRRQQMPTSEVAIKVGAREDVYLAPGSVNPETKLATLHVYVNPFTSWIWLGAMIVLIGAAIATWPDSDLEDQPVTAYLRTAGAVATSLFLSLLLAMTPTYARAAQQTGGGSSIHAGDVQLKTPQEKRLFSNLLCMCGTCERLPLTNCACGWADDMRQRLAARMAIGESEESITAWYSKEYGTSALNVPPSRGFLRTLWVVPTLFVLAGGTGAVFLIRSWKKRAPAPKPTNDAAAEEKDDYDSKLDEELRNDP